MILSIPDRAGAVGVVTRELSTGEERAAGGAERGQIKKPGQRTRAGDYCLLSNSAIPVSKNFSIEANLALLIASS